jgi:hypothetical protein
MAYFKITPNVGNVTGFPAEWSQEQRSKAVAGVKRCMVMRLAQTIEETLPSLRNSKVWQDEAGDFFFQADNLEEFDPDEVATIMRTTSYDGMNLEDGVM